MADLHFISSMNRRKGSRTSASRLAPDMTSMVGLGFLLVTFFIMAGEFMKSSVMQLTMPMRPSYEENTGIICRTGNVVTLLLGKNHQVHYFLGLTSSDIQPELYTTNFGSVGLRQLLLKIRQQNPETIVLIKTSADAKYKDMVDVLDEMSITGTRKYALVDIEVPDVALLQQHNL